MEHTVGGGKSAKINGAGPTSSVNPANLRSIRADFAALLLHENVTYSPHTKCNGLN